MTKKLIILLIISTLVLGGCGVIPELPEPEPNYPVYRALLVGVGDYIVYSDLKSPRYNVERMRKIFANCRFTEGEIEFSVINTLVDKDATKSATLEGIANTFAGADDNDISYFYWNGHGGASVEPHIDPSDIDPQNMKGTWISVHELESALSAIPGTKVVILDTCFSGSFIGRDFARALLVSDDYQVITSCRGQEVSYEVDWLDEPYTHFTMGIHLACKNLSADKDEDGIINLKELWESVRNYHRLCSGTQYHPRQSKFPIIEY